MVEKKCLQCDRPLMIMKEHFEYEGSGAIRIERAYCLECDMFFTIRENFALVDRVIGIE